MAGANDEQAGAPLPAGERQGINATFTAGQIARAFDIDAARVARAIAGEFGGNAETGVDSRQAQRLSEVLLFDQPLENREAALMRLGAFTPRPDEEWGIGDEPPGEESDRLAASADKPANELASKNSSYAPSTQDSA
ncbi:MAG TPA: hypothetical protein VFL82_11295 [Thermomicrobiales bacterium]|nr:hypothetical protein [Thermomicrobiales bacterium]